MCFIEFCWYLEFIFFYIICLVDRGGIDVLFGIRCFYGFIFFMEEKVRWKKEERRKGVGIY